MPAWQLMSHSSEPHRQRTMARVGILTRTVVRSPVIKQILHVRIRHKNFNDVAIIGEDFVEVREVKHGGHLEPVAIKNDFDAKIRAAGVFGTVVSSPEDEFLSKQDADFVDGTSAVPPQLLVLTLDVNLLVYLYLSKNPQGIFEFKAQAVPMPRFERVLFDPGEHLAIDHLSRAVAVAANERELVIYSHIPPKSPQQSRRNTSAWNGPSQERQIPITGVIQHMDFLQSPADDEDHVILLLIVIVARKTKALWIEWYSSTGLDAAILHDTQTLSLKKTVPDMLIPLKNANFILVTGTEMEMWKNLLSGSASGEILTNDTIPTQYPGKSPRKPLWTSWCRPRRNVALQREREHFYLLREDGVVSYLDVTTDEVVFSDAGDFRCYVGKAFASLGDARDPDVLAVAGEMCSGSVVSIGLWATHRRMSQSSRVDTMEMNRIETVPNWAPSTDLLASALPNSHGRSVRPRDSVFVTSGRHPHGSVTELRTGIEARLIAYVNLQDFQGLTDIWTLPLREDGSILSLFSNPTSTRLVKMRADLDDPEELGIDQASAFIQDSRTLAAAFTQSGYMLQVTGSDVRATVGIEDNFEDTYRYRVNMTSYITAAAIESANDTLITAEVSGSKANIMRFRFTAGSDEYIIGEPYSIPNEVLSLAIVSTVDDYLIFIALTEGHVYLVEGRTEGPLSLTDDVSLSTATGQDVVCDSAIILQQSKHDSDSVHDYLAVMGSRDGLLVNMELTRHTTHCKFGKSTVQCFSQSAVKLFQPIGTNKEGFASSGSDFCRLSWNGQASRSLNIEGVWISDKLRPELAQGEIYCITRFPPGHLLAAPDFADSFVLLTKDELQVSILGSTPSIVPRHIPVFGSPTRLLYAEQQRTVVCASLCTDVRTFPSAFPHSRPEERRQTWPVIEFIPAKGSASTCQYDMQPGEKVYAMLEWSYKSADDKTHSLLLIGGTHIKPSGSVRGKVLFLQPTNRNWEVVDVQERRTEIFKDGPVYALALYDALTYVACAGQSIVLQRFDSDSRRWLSLCDPFILSSPGTAVSVREGLISVTTMRDSLVQLALVERAERHLDEPAFALRPVNVAPKAANTISHLLIKSSRKDVGQAAPHESANDDPHPIDEDTIALVSTRNRQVFGLTSPSTSTETTSQNTSARILFTADLPRSLTRVRQANIRPAWKPAPSTRDVVADNVIGTSADGALTGICILRETLWRRLFWLQRLCEWSSTYSLFTFRHPRYVSASTYSGYDRAERIVPIGFGSISRAAGGNKDAEEQGFLCKASPEPDEDMHIDGDVLARLFAGNEDPVEAVKTLVRETSERDDAVGTWVKAHLDDELDAVEELVKEVRILLDCWW